MPQSSVNLPPHSAKVSELAKFAIEQHIDFVIVGPEAPLAAGIADAMADNGIACFGPNQFCAQLETSKEVSKKWMQEAGVPTAEFSAFTKSEPALDYASSLVAKSGSAVVKASGLAGGKGVFVCDSQAEVESAFSQLERRFADASEVVLVEEKLVGRESSFFCFIGQNKDQTKVLPIGFAVDFKRLYNGDEGPNTGGMGCYTPVPWLPEDAESQVLKKVVEPTLAHLEKLGQKYCGFLYVGLMWTSPQKPKVIEFNCRLGDPEAQAMAVSDTSDWLEAIAFLLDKTDSHSQIAAKPKPKPVVNLVMASQDYALPPGEKPARLPAKPFPQVYLTGLGSAEFPKCFFGGVTVDHEQNVLPKGGRVASLCYAADTLEQSQRGALVSAQKLKENYWPQVHFRTDIADKAKMSLTRFLEQLAE